MDSGTGLREPAGGFFLAGGMMTRGAVNKID